MKLHLEQEINASADKVWNILGHQFADIAIWSNLEYSRAITTDEVPDGFKAATDAPVPGRATPNPLGELIEVLTHYSDSDRQFTFLGLGLPPIISRAENTTTVIEKGENQCLVTFDIEMDLKSIFKIIDPLLKRRFATSKRGPAGVIEELRVYAESNSQ